MRVRARFKLERLLTLDHMFPNQITALSKTVVRVNSLARSDLRSVRKFLIPRIREKCISPLYHNSERD
jgi:hypothetical protein